MLSMLLAALGCSTQEIEVDVLRPASVDLSQHKNLAIEHIVGEGGDLFIDELTTALSRSDWFQIVDRQNEAAIERELRRTRGDLFDPDKVAELGKLLGAKALIHGQVNTYSYQEDVSRSEWTDEETKEVHYMSIREGQVLVEVTLRVSATDTGKVLYSNKFREQASDAATGFDREPDYIDPQPLFDSCRYAIVQEFVGRISPRRERVWVRLYKDGDIPLLESGNNMARIGDWDEAIQMYETALETLPAEYAEYRYMPLFNIGVAHQYTNRFDDAEKFFKDAYRVSPEALIVYELQKLSFRRREFQELQRQGLVE